MGAEGLGREGRVVALGGQRQVQLRRALAQQARLLQEVADALGDVRRRLLVDEVAVSRAGAAVGTPLSEPLGQRALEEALRLVDREAPGVALVGHPAGEHAERARSAPRARRYSSAPSVGATCSKPARSVR